MSKKATAPAPVADQPAEVKEVKEAKWHEKPKTIEELAENDRIREAELNPPPPPSTPDPAPKEPVAPVVPAEPVEPTPSEPASLEEVFKKHGLDPRLVKAKVKIDGEEREVTFEELQKGYQTDQHLSKRGNKISEERRELERIRQELKEQLSQRTPGAPAPAVSSEEIIPSSDPMVLQLQQEVAELRAIKAELEPVLHDRARNRVAEKLKADGFDDFNEYLPKIATFVATVEDPAQFNYYNTPEGAEALYFRFKAQDAMKQSKAPAPAAPAAPKPVTERPRPPIVRIPDAGNAGTGVVDDYDEKYAAAMKELKRTGNREAVNELLRLKGY